MAHQLWSRTERGEVAKEIVTGTPFVLSTSGPIMKAAPIETTKRVAMIEIVVKTTAEAHPANRRGAGAVGRRNARTESETASESATVTCAQ